MKNCLKLLLPILCIKSVIKASHWSYINQDEWGQDFKDCGLKSEQSPIEINPNEAIRSKLPALNFQYYDNVYRAMLKNNGHTVRLLLQNNILYPEISSGPLKPGNKYFFDNVHFHWGANDSVGSDHVIDGHHYPLELHLVHRNAKYDTAAEAFKQADGFAVIARFFKPQTGDNFVPLKELSDLLPSIEKFDAESYIFDFKLQDYFEDIAANEDQIYYTYRGSMTTPPCSEVVDWLIFTEPIPVDAQQLAAFRRVQDEYGNIMVNNFRPLQDKEGRKVYVNML